MEIQTLIKPTLDGLSFSVVVATIMNWLPAIAALFTIVWTIIRIYETKTIQQWINK